MKRLKKIISLLEKEADFLEFPEFIYQARTRLGFTQRMVQKHTKLTNSRLKKLEDGIFRIMPRKSELISLSEVYGIHPQLLHDKALEYLKGKKPGKNIRFFSDLQNKMYSHLNRR